MLLAAQALWAWRACGGTWTYAFDDAYIHLAIAHNLAFEGVWGVSPREFASASSSPLWTLLLALGLRFSNSEWVPLALNALSGAGVLATTAHQWKTWASSTFAPRWQAVGLVGLCLVAPLPLLALIGMEHTLHALLAVLFLTFAARAVGEWASARSLPVWALLLAGARFEGVFLVGFAALALARQKRFLAAAGTLGAGFMPFVLHGLMAWSQGWPFVAASVALKTARPELSLAGLGEFVLNVLGHWFSAWPCSAMAALAWALARQRPMAPSLRVALRLFGATVLFHLALARVSSFFRYEAYLFVLGVATLWPALVLACPRERSVRAALLHGAALCVLLAWSTRGWIALRDGSAAPRNIFLQQRQIALFVERFYPGETVALNDIGTTDWSAVNRPRGRVALDLVGLTDRDIMAARLKTPHLDLPPAVAQSALRQHNVRLAIVYDEWFPPQTFGSGWTRVAHLDSGRRVVSAFGRVAFWTTAPNAPRLRAQLRVFQSQLPVGARIEWQ